MGMATLESRDVFTTGEVARACGVAPRTASKWVDRGLLQGYRIPGSRDRRVKRDVLVNFMMLHGMPLNGLATGRKRVLVIDGDRDAGEVLANVLNADFGYEATAARSAFDAGRLAAGTRPHVVLLDIGSPDAAAVADGIRSDPRLGLTRIVAVAASPPSPSHGFDGYLGKPYRTDEAERAVREALQWRVK